MRKPSLTKLNSNENGMAAIIVAVLMMIVLSLIVLAMSQDTNREQRQTLDRQLSDQAFYNAESGINDVANYIYTTPTAPIIKDKCDIIPELNRDIDGPNGTNKYSCVMYDKAPRTIQFDSISTSSPRVVPIQPVDDTGAPRPLSKLTISWDDSTNRDAAITGSCNFNSGAPELPASCNYGGVRLELITPASTRDNINRFGLVAFLLPNSSSGTDISTTSLAFPDNKGVISATKCNGAAGTRRCSKTITDMSSTSLYLNLRSLYQPVNLSISGVDASNNPVRFKDSQIMIDATGRANDVLRRVQVRIPATSQYQYPGFAIQSKDSICKVIEVKKDNGTGGVTSTNPGECPIN